MPVIRLSFAFCSGLLRVMFGLDPKMTRTSLEQDPSMSRTTPEGNPKKSKTLFSFILPWLMYTIKKPAATIWAASGQRIQSRRCWWGGFCMRKVSATNSTIAVYQASPTWFSPNTKPSFLFMDVSGMDIRIASIMWCRRQEPSFGWRRSIITKAMMKERLWLYEKPAGKFFTSGNVT